MKRKQAYSKKEQRVLNTFVKLVRGTETMLYRTHLPMMEKGMTLSQFQVLEVLYHLGPLFQRDIAQKILKTTGNLTMVINNLSKRNLVKKVQDETDRRYQIISLTAKGKKLMEEFFPIHLKALLADFEVLTAEEQDQLAYLCKKIGLGNATGNK